MWFLSTGASCYGILFIYEPDKVNTLPEPLSRIRRVIATILIANQKMQQCSMLNHTMAVYWDGSRDGRALTNETLQNKCCNFRFVFYPAPFKPYWLPWVRCLKLLLLLFQNFCCLMNGCYFIWNLIYYTNIDDDS